MGFFDKLGANLTNESRKLSQKVKNSSDASKLMSEITAENKNIQENLTAIGRMYYDNHKDEPDEMFRDMVDAIAKSEQRITELQESIRVIRAREPELVPVPEDIPASARTQQTKPSAMVCMGCGNTYPSGTAFCSVCGQKLVPQYQDASEISSAPAQTAEDIQFQTETTLSEEEKAEAVDAEIIETTAENSASSEEISGETAKFCPYCGKEIQIPNQAFCENCGHAV
ncbi:MAG: zinc-ribbon domain-containing protein [Oscillospiraceae bacterium]|nr:zinc-ribbon domain-containing protein [Oscillospiraceae bacterium]